MTIRSQVQAMTDALKVFGATSIKLDWQSETTIRRLTVTGLTSKGAFSHVEAVRGMLGQVAGCRHVLWSREGNALVFVTVY